MEAGEQLWSIASAAAVTVVGALAAGISAVIRVRLASRDQRTRASGHLELARKRAEFAVAWLDAMRSLHPDGSTPEDVELRVREELEGAYNEARRGLREGTAALEVDRASEVVGRLRGFLLLRRGLSRGSKVIVALFYLLVMIFAVVLSLQSLTPCTAPVPPILGPDGQTILQPGPDPMCEPDRDWLFVGNGLGYVATMIVVIAVLRFLFVRWLDRRERRQSANRPVEVET